MRTLVQLKKGCIKQPILCSQKIFRGVPCAPRLQGGRRRLLSAGGLTPQARSAPHSLRLAGCDREPVKDQPDRPRRHTRERLQPWLLLLQLSVGMDVDGDRRKLVPIEEDDETQEEEDGFVGEPGQDLEEEEDCTYVPSALLGADGSRPHDAEIHDVHKDGRCFDDANAPSLQQQYRAQTANHYDFEAFDPTHYLNPNGTVNEEMKEMYEYAKECELKHARERQLRAQQNDDGSDAVGVGVRADGTRVDTLADGAEADGQRFAEDEGPDLQPSHDDKVERGQTGMDMGFVKTPACQAKGSPPNHVKCYQCGKRPGWELQMPSEVIETAWRANDVDWGPAAIGCLVIMAKLLRCARDAEVVARCTVCNNVDCLLRSGVMHPEWRITWLNGPRRPQDERETARKDQVALLERNIRYFHDLVKGKVLCLLDVQHLMRYVSMNSQFVQEREKKFIATAMAVAENEYTFGYRFPDPQRFVNRMANFSHGYMIHVVVPHIMDLDMTDAQWEAHLQKLIDTALPKAPDVIYALMVEANAEQGNFEREPAAPLHEGFDATKDELPFGEHVQTTGRFVHRVGFGNAALMKMFLPEHFLERLKKCVEASPHYELDYVSSAKNKHANAGNAYAALRVANTEKGIVKIKRFEIHVAMRALNGPYDKRITTPANGVAELPSSGDLQYETNVHPRLRYHNLWRAFSYEPKEVEDRVAMMLEYHPERNSIGKEQLRSGNGAKACYTLRMPVVGIPFKCDPSKPPTVKASKRLDIMTSLSPATFVLLGSQATQSRGSMCQRYGKYDENVVLTRQVKIDGSISLLGSTSLKPEHEGMAAQTYALARDMQTARVMTESARNIARVLELHQNRSSLPGLPLMPMRAYFDYARQKHADDPTFVDLDFETQYGAIEATAWARWWEKWERARPDKKVPHNVRVLVKALHDANGALNDFAEEWGGLGDDATLYDVSPQAHGKHGRPSVLYANLNVMNSATLGASFVEQHEMVQELLSSYHAIRTYTILFINAYETNTPEAHGTTFTDKDNSRGAAARDAWHASKSTRAAVPEAVTRANVRDAPAYLDAPNKKSESVKMAMKAAKFNAGEVWKAFEPAIGDAITREEFETMGAQRAWAIERKRREENERRFAASGWACKHRYCEHFQLDYDSTFEDPAVHARRQYAEILKTLADVECDRRNERLDTANKGIDLARKRHADAMQREDVRQRQAQGLDNAQAQHGRRRARVRAPHIPPAPPADAKAKIVRAKANAKKKRKVERALIERFEQGEHVEPFQSKFEEAMRVRYGGMCQYYVHNRRSKPSMDDKWALARRTKAAILANADDDEYETRNARTNAEAAINRGAIDAEMADDADDVAEAASRELDELAAAAPGGNSADVAPVLQVDDESLGLALHGVRLNQERRTRNATQISSADRQEVWDDELVRPASPIGRGLPQRAR